MPLYHIINFGLYCSASARCANWISSHPTKSAIVRASLRIWWYARADRLSWLIAARLRLGPFSGGLQNFRISPTPILALQTISEASRLEHRFLWISRAACTSARIQSDDSPTRSPLSFSRSTFGTSVWISIQLSRGQGYVLILVYCCFRAGTRFLVRIMITTGTAMYTVRQIFCTCQDKRIVFRAYVSL